MQIFPIFIKEIRKRKLNFMIGVTQETDVKNMLPLNILSIDFILVPRRDL